MYNVIVESIYYVILFDAAGIGRNTHAGHIGYKVFLETDNFGGHDERFLNAGLTFIQNIHPNLFQVELFRFSILLYLDKHR